VLVGNRVRSDPIAFRCPDSMVGLKRIPGLIRDKCLWALPKRRAGRQDRAE
jgi:hypothetical protein